MADPNDPAIYGPVNGQYVTLSQFEAYEQSLVDANARAAAPVIQALNNQYGFHIPVPVASKPATPKLVSFTGDCTAPNKPGFPGWASFADAAAWANACTSTHVAVPSAPQTAPTATGSTAAGRGAPAAAAIAGTPAAAGVNPLHLQSHSEFGDPGSYCDYYPDDPLCDIWGGIGGGGIVIGNTGTTTVEQPVIIQQGLSATDVHGLVDGALSTVWSAVVGAIDSIVAVAIAAIQDAITALGNAIKAAFAMLSRLGGFILNALKSMLNGLLHTIIQVLQDIRNILKKLATDVLLPLAKAIGSLRDKLLDLYRRFIRPMLIVLQDIRRVLNILAIFHVPFAQKLDAKLADLERRITAPFLLLLRYTNQVANWINLIITANYLLQKPVFLASLNAYKGESINLLANAMNTPASAAVQAKAAAAFTLGDATQSKAQLTTYLQTGTGDFAAPIAQAGQTFDDFLATQG